MLIIVVRLYLIVKLNCGCFKASCLQGNICNRKALKYSLPSCDRCYTEFAKRQRRLLLTPTITWESVPQQNHVTWNLRQRVEIKFHYKFKKCLHKGADKVMCLCIFWQQSIFNSVWLRRIHKKINHTIFFKKRKKRSTISCHLLL